MTGEDSGAVRRPARLAGLVLLVAVSAPTPLTPSPRSLAQALAERFPAIRSRLQSDVRFERISWRDGGRRVAGLRVVLPPAEPNARPLPPAPSPGAAAAEAAVVDRVRVTLPSLSSDPVVAEGEGVRVVLAPLGARAARAETEGAIVGYGDVYPETDALHVAKPDWTEEYLHLRSPAAPRRFEYEIVEAAGATLVEIDNGQVRFVRDDGKGVVVLAPVVVDAIGRRSARAARWILDERSSPRRLALELDPAGLEYPLLVDPSWITTGSLATARIDPIGILLHNGKVLVMGNAASAELYDPATGTWTPAGAGWTARGYHAATMLRHGRVLACGGTSGTILADCRIYDPDANAWSVTGSMSTPRQRFTLTLLANGRVLAAGGESALNTPVQSAEIYSLGSGAWAPTGSMVTAHRSHAATTLADGKVLVAGGLTLPGPSTTKVSEVFDPAAGTWTRVGDLSVARGQLSTTRLPDGRVLAAGGGLFAINTAEIFDSGTGLWTTTANLLTVRTDHSATLLPNGRVLAAGGLNGSAHSSTESYDPATGLWTPGPTMAFARYRHSATMLPDGRLLVAGGWNGAALLTAELLDNDAPAWTAAAGLGAGRREPSLTLLKNGKVLAAGGVGLDTAEVYDPFGGSWTPTVNNLIGVRYRHTSTLLGDGQVLVAGSVVSGAVGITAELYDPPSNRWSPTGSMSVDRNWHTATLLPCGEVLVVGGQTAGGTVLRSAERYNPKTKTWRLTTSLATGRWKHTATLLANGRVLVTGGFNGGELASAEVYDPVNETWTSTAGPMGLGRYHHLASLLPNGRVLIAGGFNTASAELFDPAAGTFAMTGAATMPIGFGSSATLLANGRVLGVGGFFAPASSSVYDPGEGTWTPGPALAPGRDTHAASLLLDGRLLVAGGSAAPTSSATFDVGRGELSAWRPSISSLLFDPLEIGSPLFVSGSGFKGLGEASSGLGYMQSATGYPLVQIRRLDSEQVRWLPPEPTLFWGDTSFTSTRIYGFGSGPAVATVFTNGIPSASRVVTVECPQPTIDIPPESTGVCVGSSAVLSMTTFSAGSDCPTYQWRKSGVLLSDAPPLSGTQTPTLTISPAGFGEAGSYTVEVSLACSSTVATSPPATLSVHGAMGAVDASIAGPANVCTTCLGGVASEAHSGGGAVTHQWGYRTTSGGAMTDIPFATSPTYVLNGADFPALGNYFLVVRVTPACGAAAISDEVPVTVQNAAGPADEVPFFTVTSRDSQNVLEWVFPAAYNKVRIRYTSGAPCAYPANGDTGGSFLMDVVGLAGARDGIPHNSVANGVTYCYTIFVDTTGSGAWSTGKTNSGTPFATGGPLKWAFHSGMFSTTAPTVGAAGVLAVNNDNAVHAMTRGLAGGEWPAGWKPLKLGGAVQSRSPIIPIPVGGSSQVMFLGAQDGNLYAVDAVAGAAAAAPWPGPTTAGGLVQAAPAGLFSALGAPLNYLLVGTRVAGADNAFKAFDPGNGSLLATFDNGGGFDGIGIISSMATVDLSTKRVYFTSAVKAGGSANTLWCLQLGPPGPVLSLLWARDDLGSIESGPVLRGGRIYVGSTNGGGTLYSINATTGSSADDRTFVHGDGPVKGFVFPDRNSPTGDLYFAADTRVWGVTENGPVLANKFGAGIPLPGGAAPSTLLFHPARHYIYVGGSNGWLYQIDTLGWPPTADYAAQLGSGPLTIGAPSLDIGHQLLHVGSEPGTFFAVAVPVASPNLCTASCVGKPIGMACTTATPPCSQTCDGAGNCN